MTDLGNAERFHARNHHRLQWRPAMGWLAWDGQRWTRQEADTMVRLATHETARAIQLEAAAVRNTASDIVVRLATSHRPEQRLSDALMQWGRLSEADARLTAMFRLAASYLTHTSQDSGINKGLDGQSL